MHIHPDHIGNHEHEHEHEYTHTHSHEHDGQVHEHSHSHSYTHTHEHVHDHEHEHTHVHEHEHPHDHSHDHCNEAGHDCSSCGGCGEHTPMEELIALMKYMVGHNTAHANELAALAQQLEKAGAHSAFEQVMAAVSDFEKGNLRLSAVLSSLDVK